MSYLQPHPLPPKVSESLTRPIPPNNRLAGDVLEKSEAYWEECGWINKLGEHQASGKRIDQSTVERIVNETCHDRKKIYLRTKKLADVTLAVYKLEVQRRQRVYEFWNEYLKHGDSMDENTKIEKTKQLEEVLSEETKEERLFHACCAAAAARVHRQATDAAAWECAGSMLQLVREELKAKVELPEDLLILVGDWVATHELADLGIDRLVEGFGGSKTIRKRAVDAHMEELHNSHKIHEVERKKKDRQTTRYAVRRSAEYDEISRGDVKCLLELGDERASWCARDVSLPFTNYTTDPIEKKDIRENITFRLEGDHICITPKPMPKADWGGPRRYKNVTKSLRYVLESTQARSCEIRCSEGFDDCYLPRIPSTVRIFTLRGMPKFPTCDLEDTCSVWEDYGHRKWGSELKYLLEYVKCLRLVGCGYDPEGLSRLQTWLPSLEILCSESSPVGQPKKRQRQRLEQPANIIIISGYGAFGTGSFSPFNSLSISRGTAASFGNATSSSPRTISEPHGCVLGELDEGDLDEGDLDEGESNKRRRN